MPSVQAHEEYLRTAIGNAPWPIGLTMVGIHERTGREKIMSNKVRPASDHPGQAGEGQQPRPGRLVSHVPYDRKGREEAVDANYFAMW